MEKGACCNLLSLLLLLCIKTSECNSIKCNSNVIINRAKDHYENDKIGLMKQARHKYRNLSEEKLKRENMEKIDINV